MFISIPLSRRSFSGCLRLSASGSCALRQVKPGPFSVFCSLKNVRHPIPGYRTLLSVCILSCLL
ncbi:hypothetical protein BO223_11105 [Faecalibaculum rodentium]|uniref:Uncharacterized protein n=1 Tax=Faecalibaculum rodentium TaxID=1702221 RepID=A0A1Q9YHS3_9FIRM|nr:hypothetical protein BO223_11105 [Faecalibaculum rodentium]